MTNRKLNIKESDRNEILGLYYGPKTYMFDQYLTIDNRFYIKDDVIFDLQEQKEIGDIFSLDNLKILFEGVNIKSSLIDEAKKVLYEITNEKFTILEIKREILIKKTLLTEQEATTVPQTGQNTTVGSKIAGGVLYLARKLKSILWSVGGMAADALLVASGIGKTFQWIPWAILLVLDTYEWTTGDYGSDEEFKNSSDFWKTLTIGFDVMGMMAAGMIAKQSKKIFEPIKAYTKESQIVQWVAKNPQAKNILTKISTLLSGAISWLTKGANAIMTKMPTMGKWMSSSIQSVGNLINKVGTYISRILGAPGKLANKAGEAIQGTKYGTKLLGKAGSEGAKNLGGGLKSATNTAAMIGGVNAVAQSSFSEDEISNSLKSAGLGTYRDGIDY